MRRWLAMALALVCACVTGCTSTVPVNPGDSQELATRVRPGDTVALVTRAGTRTEVVVSAVDRTSITGNGVQYPLDDLQSLEVQKFDAAKTGIGGMVALYAVVVVLFLVFIASGIPPGMPG